MFYYRNGEEVIPEIFQVIQPLELKIDWVTLKSPSLADVYLHFTGRELRNESGSKEAGFVILIVITTLFSFAMSGVSLSIAMSIKTIEGLHPVLNFLTMPMIFMSNAIFPEAAMPSWLKAISAWNPLSYAVTSMRTLVIKGWTWEEIILGTALTLLFALVMVLVVTWQFKRSIA